MPSATTIPPGARVRTARDEPRIGRGGVPELLALGIGDVHRDDDARSAREPAARSPVERRRSDRKMVHQYHERRCCRWLRRKPGHLGRGNGTDSVAQNDRTAFERERNPRGRHCVQHRNPESAVERLHERRITSDPGAPQPNRIAESPATLVDERRRIPEARGQDARSRRERGGDRRSRRGRGSRAGSWCVRRRENRGLRGCRERV